MAGLSDYLENKLIDHVFRGISYSMPSTLYVGLHTADPTDAGGVGELSGNGYARVALSPSASSWLSTNGASSGASSGTAGTTSNNVLITFPTPTANWGTVTNFSIYDVLTGGNILLSGTLTSAKTVNQGDIVSFSVSSLVVTFS